MSGAIPLFSPVHSQVWTEKILSFVQIFYSVVTLGGGSTLKNHSEVFWVMTLCSLDGGY